MIMIIWKPILFEDIRCEQGFYLPINLQESHQERNERITSPFEYFKESSEEDTTDETTQKPRLNDISYKCPNGRFVETVFCFQDEGGVYREWNFDDGGDEAQS